MKSEDPKPITKKKTGRKPSINPANYRYTVNFTEKDHALFLSLFEQSGAKSKSRFIVARIFNQEFKVIKIDSSMKEFISILSNLHAQFRSVGVNINQITRTYQTHFSEKKAERLLQDLLRHIVELLKIHSQVLEILDKLKEENPIPKSKNAVN